MTVWTAVDRLADASGGGVGEPGQRGPADALDDVAAQPVAQFQVRQVGDEQSDEVQQETPGVGADEEHDDAAHPLPVGGQTGVVGVQEDIAQAHERDVGGHGQQAGEDDEHLADPQGGAHRGAQTSEGGLAPAGSAGVVLRDRRAPPGPVGPGGRGRIVLGQRPALAGRGGCGPRCR